LRLFSFGGYGLAFAVLALSDAPHDFRGRGISLHNYVLLKKVRDQLLSKRENENDKRQIGVLG